LRTRHLAEFFGLGSFFLCQTIGFARHFVKASIRVLLLGAAKKVGGFAEAVGGAAGFGVALLAGGGLAHVVVGLLQAIESLLNTGIAGTLLAGLATLARLPGLPGLPRLP
jgi:hypothetical protein